jgi:hypothetical protein
MNAKNRPISSADVGGFGGSVQLQLMTKHAPSKYGYLD